MLQVYVPPQITCGSDVRSLSELSVGVYSSVMSTCQISDELFVPLTVFH